MAHVGICPECDGEMDVSTASPYDRVACPHCGEQSRPKMSFDGHTLQSRLAWGGMSVVFIAYDESRRCEVAVKILSDTYCDDPVRIAQFEREGQLTSATRHPHIVTVHTVGHAFGRSYIAMELVRGESLEQLVVGREPIPEQKAIQIGLQTIAGLEAVQASGLIHRDIKPGNILVGEDDVVKIIDFGLAMETQGGQVRAQEVFATPYYVSPEALDGADEDFRSDIYSLGASLYHALSGQAPFELNSTDVGILSETKKAVLPLHEKASWVSKPTAQVIDKSMAFLRSDRFSSYSEFAEALEEASQGRSISSVAESRTRRKGERTFPIAIIASICGVLLFLVFLVWAITVLSG